MKRIMGFFLLAMLVSFPSFAWNIHKVKMAATLWENFTHEDGTGLYNEIIDAVFDLYDIQVVRKYIPFKRGIFLVEKREVDFYTCATEEDLSEKTVLATHPMFQDKFHVFFHKDTVPSWQGQSSMENKKVVWRLGYYTEEELHVKVSYREVRTGVIALKNVLYNRADFYLDYEGFIRESIKKSGVEINMEEYRIEEIGVRSYYPIFLLSERGNVIMNLYDEGIEKLYTSGDLQKIYEKWGYQMPNYTFD